MATITASGIGSGLDVEGIVKSLLAVERQPLDKLETQQQQLNAQVSAYGSLKSKIADFQSAMAALASTDSFKLYQAASSDDDVLTATVDESATVGSYNIEVTALAERDKLRTAAYTDISSVVGEGTLAIAVGSDSFSIDISAANGNNTLEGLRDAINSASDNTGVTATTVTDANGSSLVLSSNETGVENALTVSVSGDSDGNDTDPAGLSALVYSAGGTKNLTALTTATDGQIRIDGAGGFTINSSTNSFSSAIEGVTITAKKLGSLTLSVSRDDDAIKTAVNKFAEAYNALRDEMTMQRAGQLEADSTLLTMEGQLLGIFNAGTAISGSSYNYLSQIGLKTNDKNHFTIDSSELTDAIESDFNSFVNLFADSDNGFASRLSSLADSWLSTNGLINTREDGLQARLDRNEDDQLKWESRLELIETRLRSQFTALDTLVSELNSTGDFLTRQLATLNNRTITQA